MTDHRPTDRARVTTSRRAAALGVSLLLPFFAACGGDDGADNPDPGAPGSETEIDGGESGGGSGTTSSIAETTGGSQQGTDGGMGSTQGNQMTPGDTTPSTARGATDG